MAGSSPPPPPRWRGWPGSSLRLWHARLPLNPQQAGSGLLAVTATAYDAAGHVLGQVKLGQMW